MIDLCERFRALPSAVLAEDSRIIGMIMMADERPSAASGAADGDHDWG